jgi:hypothetical protein
MTVGARLGDAAVQMDRGARQLAIQLADAVHRGIDMRRQWMAVDLVAKGLRHLLTALRFQHWPEIAQRPERQRVAHRQVAMEAMSRPACHELTPRRLARQDE